MPLLEATKLKIIGLHEIGCGARKIKTKLQTAYHINHSLSGIQYVINKWENTQTIGRKKGSGPQISARRKQCEHLVRQYLDPENPINPTKNEKPLSIRRTARLLNISRCTVHRIARKDLKLNLFKKIRTQKLTAANKVLRLSRCQHLLNYIGIRKLSKVLFTDEKIFTIEGQFNSQNSRIWTTLPKKVQVSAERLLVARSHFPQSVMVFGGVSLNGRTRLTFVENNVKVNSEYYQRAILPRAIADCRSQIGEGFIWHQDGASSHTSQSTQKYLARMAPGFISKTMWPPNSPDLNPMDYGIWGAMEEKVFKNPIKDLNHLKEVITETWRRLSQRFIRKLIRQFRQRLELVVEHDGGNIEHLL